MFNTTFKQYISYNQPCQIMYNSLTITSTRPLPAKAAILSGQISEPLKQENTSKLPSKKSHPSYKATFHC